MVVLDIRHVPCSGAHYCSIPNGSLKHIPIYISVWFSYRAPLHLHYNDIMTLCVWFQWSSSANHCPAAASSCMQSTSLRRLAYAFHDAVVYLFSMHAVVFSIHYLPAEVCSQLMSLCQLSRMKLGYNNIHRKVETLHHYSCNYLSNCRFHARD